MLESSFQNPPMLKGVEHPSPDVRPDDADDCEDGCYEKVFRKGRVKTEHREYHLLRYKGS